MARLGASLADIRRAGFSTDDAGIPVFSSAGQQSPTVNLTGPFWLALWYATAGAGGQVALEVSYDGGTRWLNYSQANGTDNLWNVPVALPYVNDIQEPNVLFRLRCAALTSGTVGYRLSQ